MEELLHRDLAENVTTYCAQLEQEALTLGVIGISGRAIYRLAEEARNGGVTQQILAETWEAFGPICAGSPISAVATVKN